MPPQQRQLWEAYERCRVFYRPGPNYNSSEREDSDQESTEKQYKLNLKIDKIDNQYVIDQ